MESRRDKSARWLWQLHFNWPETETRRGENKVRKELSTSRTITHSLRPTHNTVTSETLCQRGAFAEVKEPFSCQLHSLCDCDSFCVSLRVCSQAIHSLTRSLREEEEFCAIWFLFCSALRVLSARSIQHSRSSSSSSSFRVIQRNHLSAST